MNRVRPTSYADYLTRAEQAPFPPQTAQHVLDYRHEDVMQGYLDAKNSERQRGGNNSSSYRWGWANRLRDVARVDDGFDVLRHEALAILASEDVDP